MTKQELFNQIYETYPPIFDNEKVQSTITDLISAIKREVENDSDLRIQDIINIIIDFAFKSGITVSIDVLSSKLELPDDDFNILSEIENKLEIDTYNAIRISKRPTHF